MGPIGNKSELVQVLAWCQTGNKPLAETMMTLFTDAFMHHQTSMTLPTDDDLDPWCIYTPLDLNDYTLGQ